MRGARGVVEEEHAPARIHALLPALGETSPPVIATAAVTATSIVTATAAVTATSIVTATAAVTATSIVTATVTVTATNIASRASAPV